jgi:hypothetical protein
MKTSLSHSEGVCGVCHCAEAEAPQANSTALVLDSSSNSYKHWQIHITFFRWHSKDSVSAFVCQLSETSTVILEYARFVRLQCGMYLTPGAYTCQPNKYFYRLQLSTRSAPFRSLSERTIVQGDRNRCLARESCSMNIESPGTSQ